MVVVVVVIVVAMVVAMVVVEETDNFFPYSYSSALCNLTSFNHEHYHSRLVYMCMNSSPYSLAGERSPVNTGVWIGQNKVSAVGVTASRWITMHGISLNVSCDLSPYERIVPCGINVAGMHVCNMVQQQQFTRPPLAAEDGGSGSTLSGNNNSSSGSGTGDHSQLATINIVVSSSTKSGTASRGNGRYEVDEDIDRQLMKDVADKWAQSFAKVFELSLHYPENPVRELDNLLNSKPHIRDLTLEEIS